MFHHPMFQNAMFQNAMFRSATFPYPMFQYTMSTNTPSSADLQSQERQMQRKLILRHVECPILRHVSADMELRSSEGAKPRAKGWGPEVSRPGGTHLTGSNGLSSRTLTPVSSAGSSPGYSSMGPFPSCVTASTRAADKHACCFTGVVVTALASPHPCASRSVTPASCKQPHKRFFYRQKCHFRCLSHEICEVRRYSSTAATSLA